MDQFQHNYYVCSCGTLLSTTASIDVNVWSSSCKSNPHPPCSIFSAKAIIVTQTKESGNDEKRPINFHPASGKVNADDDRFDITFRKNEMNMKTGRDVITTQVQAMTAPPGAYSEHRLAYWSLLKNYQNIKTDINLG
ncbi:hypothetical protein FBU30_001582, partial [Linnemannia zychae]